MSQLAHAGASSTVPGRGASANASAGRRLDRGGDPHRDQPVEDRRDLLARTRRSRRPPPAGPTRERSGERSAPFARPPAIRTAPRVGVDRGERGVDVRRLRVVHEPDTVDERDHVAAVLLGREARDAAADRIRRDAERQRGGRGRGGVGAISGPFGVDRSERLRGPPPVTPGPRRRSRPRRRRAHRAGTRPPGTERLAETSADRASSRFPTWTSPSPWVRITPRFASTYASSEPCQSR